MGSNAAKLRVAWFLLAATVSAPAAADLVFTAPPRESAAKAKEVYQPIADFLSKISGQKVVFRYTDNWLSYQSDMRKGLFDIVFDGPAFIGWRMAKLDHTPLVKLPGNLAFVVVVKKDNTAVKELKDLAGRKLCGFAPPNLATLTVLVEFTNPARQPLLVETKGFQAAYKAVVDGKCDAGILQTKLWQDFDKEKSATKPVFNSKPVPNQAFSAGGPRVSPELRAKFAEALMTEDGKAATKLLRDEFKGQDFVPAKKEEYEGLGALMRDVWGFEL
ncbi:MAG: PhnD/SsuA/transferrin family substrate-binding protein [Gammaproteobacteria bacterium]|nr:PhnD/SsuA/transferrin family substrate-binding protein [Gammaproteobacteria bacterium]